ncbi:ATP-binding protein [Streptomyces sp. NPDC026673]|uniref:ATP-binding protein n=1 Tax=Streptomyces sp. NPDC026673 TaxID=3155724 RepID=UPI0033D3E20F
MNETTPPVEWWFSRHPRSVGRARARLREQAEVWGLPPDAVETAVLLLSELMSNAVRHARVPPDRRIAARAALASGVLRVEVCDAGDGLPVPRRVSASDESGRGLALVETLADAWNVQPRPYGIGKAVWFELRVTKQCVNSSDQWPDLDVGFAPWTVTWDS